MTRSDGTRGAAANGAMVDAESVGTATGPSVADLVVAASGCCRKRLVCALIPPSVVCQGLLKDSYFSGFASTNPETWKPEYFENSNAWPGKLW